MAESSRRNFLILAGAGAAAAGVAATLPAGAAGATPSTGNATAAGPLLAYVKDARSGELTLMVGEREVVVRDRDLVNRLARAAQ